jgi:hypothetical protein
MALAARVYQHDEEVRRRPASRRQRRTLVRVRVAGKGARVTMLVAVPLALVLAYVWLTAQLTSQTYRLHDDQARQAVLVQRDNELRQQVARLESLPRLQAAAAKLHMSVPQAVTLVSPSQLPRPAAPTAIAASLDDMRKWFGLR